MSGREWKPGDVALVEAGCWANRKVALRLDEGWAHTNGVNVDGDGVVDAVRPLVVIDPEDRQEVARLMGLYAQTDHDGMADGMQAALREYANPKPPKPDEPQGLGAVVEDEGGVRFVRSERHADAPWDRVAEPVGGFLWSDIAAVRVLSLGVEVDQ